MADVNIGVQNKAAKGRSILDYSLVACFTLVVLLLILVLDAFEYISVPGKAALSNKFAGVTTADVAKEMASEDISKLEKELEEAKKLLKEEHDKVEKLVDRVEDEIEEEEGTTPVTAEEKKEEEEKKEAVVEAVVKKELGLDKWCGSCQYKHMNFNCDQRVIWMMESYSITREMAMESAINSCHTRLRGRV